MDKYKIIKQLGDGTYGSVLLAQMKESPQEKVAIKKNEKEILYVNLTSREREKELSRITIFCFVLNSRFMARMYGFTRS